LKEKIDALEKEERFKRKRMANHDDGDVIEFENSVRDSVISYLE
jgi:hypothetical protein